MENKMETKMQNYDSHFLLYAKGWYKRTNVILDLQKLVEQRSMVDRATVGDVMATLIHIVEKYCIDNPDFRFSFTEFVEDIMPWNNWKVGGPIEPTDNTPEEAVINKCLSMLSRVQVRKNGKDIFPIDNPNYNLLPQKEQS